MHTIDREKIEAAQLVIACAEFTENLQFFTETLGFRIDVVYPADAPRVAVVSGYGCRIRLEKNSDEVPAVLRLIGKDTEFEAASGAALVAPNGMRIEFESADAPPVLPPLRPSLQVQKAGDKSAWGTGRADMQYRDLIPDRLGGRYIASHIRISNGGPVPDYVHHHHVHFQLIYCYKGWVQVVYEDQGPPFLMKAGDCVLQPPHIRHRVLECSDGFEVVEIACPAEHATLVDHDMPLPTAGMNPDRDFGGQRFCFHQSAGASWSPWRIDGFEARDTGIAAASANIVSVSVVRPVAGSISKASSHNAEFLFNFILEGSVTLESGGNKPLHLVAGDSYTLPANTLCSLSDCSADFEFLDVSAPANCRNVS